jgi:hypothetical protein
VSRVKATMTVTAARVANALEAAKAALAAAAGPCRAGHRGRVRAAADRSAGGGGPSGPGRHAADLALPGTGAVAGPAAAQVAGATLVACRRCRPQATRKAVR